MAHYITGLGELTKKSQQFHSRHVVLKVNDLSGEVMYLVYLHLHSIAEGITVGASVSQGQLLGTVGEDDATYPHLHREFREQYGDPREGHLAQVETARTADWHAGGHRGAFPRR